MITNLSAKKIIKAFPHPTIIPIISQPNYKNIAELYLKLNANTASVVIDS